MTGKAVLDNSRRDRFETDLAFSRRHVELDLSRFRRPPLSFQSGNCEDTSFFAAPRPAFFVGVGATEGATMQPVTSADGALSLQPERGAIMTE